MKEKTIEIIAPEGYEVDKERSSFEKIVFRALPDKGLPETWEELDSIKGHFVNSGSEVSSEVVFCTAIGSKNTWPTREEAEASIALAQLCQLRDRYNGEWKKQYENEECWVVGNDDGDWDFEAGALAFKTKELCDEFEKNFSDLIERAKPLLG